MSQLALMSPLILQIKRKEKKRKRKEKENNDLADLPSHDTRTFPRMSPYISQSTTVAYMLLVREVDLLSTFNTV